MKQCSECGWVYESEVCLKCENKQGDENTLKFFSWYKKSGFYVDSGIMIALMIIFFAISVLDVYGLLYEKFSIYERLAMQIGRLVTLVPQISYFHQNEGWGSKLITSFLAFALIATIGNILMLSLTMVQ